MLEQHWSGRMDLDPRGTAAEHATLGLSMRVYCLLLSPSPRNHRSLFWTHQTTPNKSRNNPNHFENVIIEISKY